MLVTNRFLAALKSWVERKYFKGLDADDEFKLAKEWYGLYKANSEGDCYTTKLASML